MKLLICVLAIVVLAGCSSTKAVKIEPPVMAGPQQVKIPTISGPVIKVIDQLCSDDQFNKGLYDGYFMGRDKQIFTGQQLEDIAKWQAFCEKPKSDRTTYEYGYIAGRAVDSLITGLLPYLGRDAIRLLKDAGLIL